MATEERDDQRPLLTDLDELLAAHGSHTYRACLRGPALSPAPSPAPSPGWLLEELRSAGREDLDAGHVDRHDAKTDSGAAVCRRVVPVDAPYELGAT